MPTITTKDATSIYYKNCGKAGAFFPQVEARLSDPVQSLA